MTLNNSWDLAGRTAVITGSSAGLGAAAAERFVALGANVAVVGRSAERTKDVAARIDASPFVADFAELDDVRELAAALQSTYGAIDLLVNNAGGQWPQRRMTADGNEMTWQVNYLAPFLLTNLLAPAFGRALQARIVSTSSQVHMMGSIRLDDLDWQKRKYRPMKVYATSKLANVLFTRELARRTHGGSLTAISFHPGAVSSDFFREGGLFGALMKTPIGGLVSSSPAAAAEHLVRAGSRELDADLHGSYFNKAARQSPKGQGGDEDLGRQLWDSTADVLGIQSAW